MIDRLNERRRAAGEGGFTLIELLVVIIILGILAAVVVISVGGIDDRGQESACEIDERTLETAAEARFAQETAYTDLALADGGSVNVEQDYVDEKFLSKISTYHDLLVVDTDPTVAIKQGIDVNPVAPCT